jgi:hypothetical protein
MKKFVLPFEEGLTLPTLCVPSCLQIIHDHPSDTCLTAAPATVPCLLSHLASALPLHLSVVSSYPLFAWKVHFWSSSAHGKSLKMCSPTCRHTHTHTHTHRHTNTYTHTHAHTHTHTHTCTNMQNSTKSKRDTKAHMHTHTHTHTHT